MRIWTIAVLAITTACASSSISPPPISEAVQQSIAGDTPTALASETLRGERVRVAEGVYVEPPFGLSATRYAHLVKRPSMDTIVSYLLDRFESKKPQPRIAIEHRSHGHLRLVLTGVKAEVLSDRDYRELVEIKVSLASTGFETQSVTIDAPPDSPLAKELGNRREVFEMGVDVSGRYSAGGQPSDIRGYEHDLVAKHRPEVETYAAVLTEDIRRYLSGRVVTSFNAKTGARVRR